MSAYYPALLMLRGRRCVVVGGGAVAERKIGPLLDAEAEVEVISPAATQAIKELAASTKVKWAQRPYQEGDLAGAFVVIAATDDREANALVWEHATRRGALVNVVDDPSRCDFIVPSVVRRGDLIVSLSTGGKSPALAKRLSQQLEAIITPEYASLLELLGGLRDEVKNSISDPHRREMIWQELLDSDILDLLKEGRSAEAERRARQIVRKEEE